MSEAYDRQLVAEGSSPYERVAAGTVAIAFLVMFGAMVDLFIFQNPLAADPPLGATLLPGHFPTELAIEAGFADSVSLDPLAWSLTYLLGRAVLATLAFYHRTHSS